MPGLDPRLSGSAFSDGLGGVQQQKITPRPGLTRPSTLSPLFSIFLKVHLAFQEQNRYFVPLIAFALPSWLWNKGGER